ncbi:branched-chain amino acid aminotransferase [Luteipulveratus halotolerans]|uniref:Branched-chain-amino-acid aminotransferase n=1 Tax=Luteipulveratus halotolerans TaxID=1631356 RepID=A0A0L6CG45_9MICO|nr:branched-chain amino acid aminotransferase [Luteipulveratus halotolerans]KNX36684.1 branched-chain amino acid aminotransferase [Luteipulveratus halotolerans]
MSTSPSLNFAVAERPDRASDADRDAVLASPGFGQHFTDHMALATWRKGEGWGDPRVTAYGPLQLDPSAAVLHYAQEIFEGMKAYRHEDGSVWTFRPEANAARFSRSAHRLALPALDEADFLESLRALVRTDVDWVPATGGEESLYLRPFMFASESFLGVRPANEVTYCVIASPAGAYFSGGLKPVSLWISEHYSRAGVGGTGAAKCGGNYASSLAAQVEAAENGCDQSVFLDSVEQKYIEELGGMNVFLVYKDGRIVTPELSGSILEGVTRSSILELAKDLDLTPEERRITLEEWRAGAESGEITEAFACGTAAVITPVGRMVSTEGEFRTGPEGEGGPVATKIRETLLAIQTGRAEDTRGWLTRLA